VSITVGGTGENLKSFPVALAVASGREVGRGQFTGGVGGDLADLDERTRIRAAAYRPIFRSTDATNINFNPGPIPR